MVFLDLALTMADLPSDFVTERFDRYLDDVLNKLRKQSIRLGEIFQYCEARIGDIDCHPAMWEVRGYVGSIISATLVGATLPRLRV